MDDAPQPNQEPVYLDAEFQLQKDGMLLITKWDVRVGEESKDKAGMDDLRKAAIDLGMANDVGAGFAPVVE